MKKFCKALDDTSNISGSESIADLGTIFDQNTAQWHELGILQPTLTPMNGSRNCNKNGWNYIACKWEKLLQLKKRAADTGVSVDILLEAAEEKERMQQTNKRALIKQKKLSVGSGDFAGIVNDGHELGGVVEASDRSKKRCRSFATTHGITGDVACKINNLMC